MTFTVEQVLCGVIVVTSGLSLLICWGIVIYIFVDLFRRGPYP